jgi:putative membrane protein
MLGLAALAVGAGLYVAGTRRLAIRGRRWPTHRGVAFALGLVAAAVAFLPPLATYEDRSFSAHVAQHVLLAMVAPTLVALGAPLTLVLQAGSRPAQRRALRLLHCAPARLLGHPVVAGALFVGSLVGLYFTPLLGWSLDHVAVHWAVHAHFFVAGYLFLAPLVGEDPVPHRLSYPARALALALTIPLHAFAGLAIVSSDTLLAAEWYDRAGQQAGGALLWATGDLIGLVGLGLVVTQWMRADQREGDRLDRRLTEAAA